MIFEGPLFGILNYFEYDICEADITDEAWDYIFEHTEMLEEYMCEKYDCWDATEFLEQNVERKFVDSEFITWNPVVFDTWDEYIDLIKGKEYAVYFENVEAPENLGAEELYLPIWEQMVKDSKKEFIDDRRVEFIEFFGPASARYLPEIAEHIESEFRNILDRYGLWYEPQFAWSLSCYRR